LARRVDEGERDKKKLKKKRNRTLVVHPRIDDDDDTWKKVSKGTDKYID
jgi:hypothetical protein